MATDDRQVGSTDERATRFMRLLLANQRRLYGFLFVMSPNRTDADDLMQETTAVLFAKFDEFEEGTDFGAWALAVARLVALKHRQKAGRRAALPLSDAIVESLADEAAARSGSMDRRTDALRECVEALAADDMGLIAGRYRDGQTVGAMAKRTGRSEWAIYRALNRVHEALRMCIGRRLAMERGA